LGKTTVSHRLHRPAIAHAGMWATIAAAAFLLPTHVAQAQSAATPAAKTPAAATPAAKAPTPATPATAAEPSPAHLAAARELVIASGMTRSFNAAIPQMMRQLTTTFTQTRPDLLPDLHIVLKQLQPEFQKQTGVMVDKAAHIFARLLTEDEINASLAFFNSPAGKKYVQAQPYFFDDVVNAMQDWHQKMSDEMITKVRAEMKKRGHVL
jgi:uncharacterized protein